MQIICRVVLCKIRAACGNYRAIYVKNIQMHVHFINGSRPPACFIRWIIDFILQISREKRAYLNCKGRIWIHLMALWILCWSGMWTDGTKAPRRLLWLKIPATVDKRRETQLVDQDSRMLLLHLQRTSKAPQQRRLIVAMTSQHDIIQAYKKQKVICEGIYFGSVFCNRPGRLHRE